MAALGKSWRVSAGIACALVAGALAFSDSASAQKYDGDGVIRFGVFGQGTFLNYNQSTPDVGSTSPGGLAAGASLGYDYRLGHHWLIGLEGDVSFGDIRGDVPGTVGVNPNVSYGFDYFATLRGRVGYYVHHDWLLYGTLGAGWLGFEAQTGPGDKASQTVSGIVGGIGTEYKWNHVILFAEYLHGSFGEQGFNIVDSTGTLRRYLVDNDIDVLRLGLKFKIGHDYDQDIGRHYYPGK